METNPRDQARQLALAAIMRIQGDLQAVKAQLLQVNQLAKHTTEYAELEKVERALMKTGAAISGWQL